MKKQLLLTILLLFGIFNIVGYAQSICGGTFTDSGGNNGNYSSLENTTTTICPSNSGNIVTVTFTAFALENNYDILKVYDGASASAPLIATLTGSTIPVAITSTNPNGCLTFVFTSDGSVSYTGWNANVTCAPSVIITCPAPTGLIVNYNSPTSLSLGWNSTAAVTQWEVLALPLNAPAPTNASVGTLTSTNPFDLTNLSELAYAFYVRAICSGTDVSAWSTALIYTIPPCNVPIFYNPTNITSTSAALNWSGNLFQYQIYIVPSGSPAPNSNSTGTYTTTSSPFIVTGLIANTSYDCYLRGGCSPNFYTDWSSVSSFTTLMTPIPLLPNTTLFSPQQLVTDVLINNPCITVTNVTSSTGTNFGSVNGLGYFTNSNPTFPISSGIILSTGNASNLSGPNTSLMSDGGSAWPGDTQLENIVLAGTSSSMTSLNASKIEFDFTSFYEFMSFNFLFASEEYGIYQCSFSDAFAFLLTDTDTGITTNIAVIPGTPTPISVITIRDAANNTECTSQNIDYFGRYNLNNNANSSATNFNGQTVKMTASSAIIPNHTYHIKLVIADRADSAFDSAVFIESGSFLSGPPICTDKVQLVAFVDDNNDGIKQSNEAIFTYGSFATQQNNAGPMTIVSSPLGSYTIYDDTANTYDFSYEINPEYAPYYSLGTTFYNDINIALNPNPVLYFPITLTQGFNDVTVSISAISPPVAGASFTNKIVYKNLGVNATSGTLIFTKDVATTISTIAQAGVVPNTNGFSYDFTNLQPNETRSFNVLMQVPAIPTVNINDVLTSNVSISAPSNDINVSNNSYTNTQIVVASYDPNDKMESHGEKIQFDQFNPNDYLFYTIRFQNTGTFNATNIKLQDVLDPKLDEQSLRMVDASHNYLMERVNNNLIWKFNFINLVSVLQSQELSKGYVTFKVKLKPGFTVNDIIPNTAGIYFDSNPAITTNTFNTKFVSILGISTFGNENINMYPNPTHTVFQISLSNTSERINHISINDLLGKSIRKIDVIGANETTIDVSDLAKGLYLIEITTQNNHKEVKKLIVE